MEDSVLTPDQVAQILQIHPFTVLKFIKQGKLKASKLGRVYRIRKSDVDLFLDEQAKQSEEVRLRKLAKTESEIAQKGIKTAKKTKKSSSPEFQVKEERPETTENYSTSDLHEEKSTTKITPPNTENPEEGARMGYDHYVIEFKQNT